MRKQTRPASARPSPFAPPKRRCSGGVSSTAEARKAQGKGLSAFDDRALHEAQNLLHSEFAYILGIEPNAVPQFIAAELGDE